MTLVSIRTFHTFRANSAILATSLVLSACSTVHGPKSPSADTTEEATTTAPNAVITSPTRSGRYTGKLSSRLDPKKVAAQLSSRAVNVSTQCSFKNETGYAGDAIVRVSDGNAKQINVTVNVPSQGQCAFDMEGFTQVRSGSMVEVRHPRDGCTARMWEQGSQVTVAFSNCASRCSPAASFKYVWPVLIDRSSGHCD